MDDNKLSGIKRSVSFSRRLSTIGGPYASGKWNRIVFVIIVLTLGIISGSFVFKLVFSEAQFDERVKHIKRQNVHEPPSSRQGISIKKDLSVQFRDYLPRNIFITTGSWYNQRESLKLFRQTYADSFKYDLFCFLEDPSHKLFFTPFKNLTIVQSKIVAEVNKTVQKRVKQFGSDDVSKNKTYFDFGAWIIDTFHQDDYIVLRMETENETSIVKHLGQIGALDWIDKYYTTSNDNDTLSVYHEVFKTLNIPLFTWKDDDFTLSDFNELINDPTVPKVTTSVITECGYYEQFLLIMYVPFVSRQGIYALEVLKAFAGPRFLQTSVFLSKDFIFEQQIVTESLIHAINVGLYMENKTYVDVLNSYNHIRSDFIEVEHVFKQFESNRVNIKYALTTDFNDYLATKLSEERFVNVFNKVLNINNLIPQFVKEHEFNFKKIKRKQGQILALDLTVENSELLMVDILKKYGSGMISIDNC